MSVIYASVVGNVGKDPEFVKPEGKAPYTKFSVAVSKKPKDGTPETTTWVNVTAFRNAENYSKWLKKGQHVTAMGSLDIRSYVNKDGAHKWSADLVADYVAPGPKREQTPSADVPKDEAGFDLF